MKRIILLGLMLVVLIFVGCSKPIVINNSTTNITVDVNTTIIDNSEPIGFNNETVVVNDTIDNVTMPVNDTVIDVINQTVVENTDSGNSEYAQYRDTDLIDEAISDVKSLN